MKIFKTICEYTFFGVAVLYFPTAFLVAALLPIGDGFMPSNYLLNLLAVFLVSLPAFVSFISLFMIPKLWSENKKAAKAIVSLTIGIALIFLQLISYVHISKLLPLSVWSAILQIIFWLVHIIVAFVKGRRPAIPVIFKRWGFWLSVALIFITVAATGSGVKMIYDNIPELSGNKEDLSYEMRCEGETVKASRGEHITLTVTLKNNSGETYSYEGSYSELKPEIVLVSEDGKFKIEHDDMPFTNDFAKHTFKHGDTRTTVFYFTVPDNAPLGHYRAEMTFRGAIADQDKVLKVST